MVSLVPNPQADRNQRVQHKLTLAIGELPWVASVEVRVYDDSGVLEGEAWVLPQDGINIVGRSDEVVARAVTAHPGLASLRVQFDV